MLNVAVIFTNYGPYHIARVNALYERFRQRDWELTGIELARREAEYVWQTTLENLSFSLKSVVESQQRETVPLRHMLPRLFAVLSETNPDVVVVAGYFEPAMIAALFWALWHRKVPIILSESTESDAPRTGWREGIKRWSLKPYKSALVGGQPQKRYLMKLGIPEQAIFCGYDVVGNNVFHPDRIKMLPPPLEKPFFLSINRFIPKKNLPFTISAYADYRKLAGDNAWDLVLCGEGAMRAQLEQQTKDLNLSESVHFPGFLQQNELLPYFAHASCFVHASTHEQWGLVVNEAMAAGLPTLVSDRCGCFEDLVIEGTSGFGFDPRNKEQLTDLMIKISLDKSVAIQMSETALKHIQNFSPDYFAQGLIAAVDYALS